MVGMAGGAAVVASGDYVALGHCGGSVAASTEPRSQEAGKQPAGAAVGTVAGTAWHIVTRDLLAQL